MKRIKVSIVVGGVKRESILALDMLPAFVSVPLHVGGNVIPVEVSIEDADAGDLPSFLLPTPGGPAASPPPPPMKGPPAGPRPPGAPPRIFSPAKVPAHELNAA